MISVKNILKKETLYAAGGLGLGSIGGEIVTSKVTTALTGDDGVVKYEKVIPAIAVFTGALLSGGTGFVKSIGHGMMAQGVSKIAKTLIPVETQISLGIGQDVMLGNVMMGESPVAGYAGSESYDFTSGTSGEMNF